MTKIIRKFNRKSNIPEYPYDNYITFQDIMLVDSETKKCIGTYKKQEAIELAHSNGLNLIQISNSKENAICIFENYSKYAYKMNKQKQAKKKLQSQSQNKEVVLGDAIDLHDMMRKLEKTLLYVVENNYSVTLVIKKRRNRGKITYFSDEFIQNFLQSNNNIQHRLTKSTHKETQFYIAKKKV